MELQQNAHNNGNKWKKMQTKQDMWRKNQTPRIMYGSFMDTFAGYISRILNKMQTWGTKNREQQTKFRNLIVLLMTCKTRFGKFRSSSSVICVRYVGRSNTGGLL